MVDQNVKGPLAGVRVVDLTRFPPGAYCTLLLADLGAEVCRVDGPGNDPAMAGVGVGLSRGKLSVGLDLRHPRGNEVLSRLAGWADVLVENNRPGDLEKRGFGYVHAAAKHPRLIWCSITGFGQDGPYATRPGHDLTYTAHSGLMTAVNSELPWHPEAMLAVPIGSLMAATGIAAALVDRDRTGRGCQLDISLAEAATWLLSGSIGGLADSIGKIPVTPDRRLYQCSDGRFVTVAASEPKTWAALCQGMGLTDLAAAGRPAADQWEEVTARMAGVFATQPAADWVDVLGPLGAAIGVVNRSAELPNDPHVRHRGSIVEVDGASVPGNPIRVRDLEGPRSTTAAASPAAPGQNTDEVLTDAGYSAEDIKELRAAGAVWG
jgi:crotonobetainyl-CoA:carnitine CoA-transferase CaiB-like acyl-CoA transferase